MRRFVLMLVVGSSVVAACGRIGDSDQPSAPSTITPGPLTANAVMVRTVDGDTIDVRVGDTAERVRLIGIDTPETKKPNSPIECYGPEASAFTAALLPAGTPLYLERDVVARDDYGRLLAYVYVTADGTFVNDRLVREGYATLLTIPPNVAHADDFIDANRAARSADVGMWANCSGDEPG